MKVTPTLSIDPDLLDAIDDRNENGKRSEWMRRWLVAGLVAEQENTTPPAWLADADTDQLPESARDTLDSWRNDIDDDSDPSTNE